MIYINKFGKLVGAISVSNETREYEIEGVYKSKSKKSDNIILGFTYII